MKAAEFDKAFDEGLNIIPHLDVQKAQRVKEPRKRVTIDFPLWMIDSLDKEATRQGVSRQSIIKVWLNDRLHQQNV